MSFLWPGEGNQDNFLSPEVSSCLVFGFLIVLDAVVATLVRVVVRIGGWETFLDPRERDAYCLRGWLFWTGSGRVAVSFEFVSLVRLVVGVRRGALALVWHGSV